MSKKEMQRTPYVKTTEDTISIRQAMEISGVSRTTLDKWFKSGKIKTYRKLNNQLLVDKVSFDQFIQERMKELNKDETEELDTVKKDNKNE